MPKVFQMKRCVLERAFARLERLEEKLSRAVLRGGETSNGLPLPDNS